MPFKNDHGYVICSHNGVFMHEYSRSSVQVTSWRPELLEGSGLLRDLIRKIPESMRVVCNPVLGESSISFTACPHKQNVPAFYGMYVIDRSGLRLAWPGKTFSGFQSEFGTACVSDYNEVTLNDSHRQVISFSQDLQVVRVVPCEDRSLPKSIIVTTLSESSEYASWLIELKSKSRWRITLENGIDVYKPTIFNKLLTHVEKSQNQRLIRESKFILS